MSELKARIHDEANGLDYILVGDYYIPAIELLEGNRHPIVKWKKVKATTTLYVVPKELPKARKLGLNHS